MAAINIISAIIGRSIVRIIFPRSTLSLNIADNIFFVKPIPKKITSIRSDHGKKMMTSTEIIINVRKSLNLMFLLNIKLP